MKIKKQAFTLAEVVITLIVIGIIAAITVPMLSNDVNDKKWNVARQRANSTIGEAFRLATVNGEISVKTLEDTSMTPEYFVTKILSKYLKLEKTCTSAEYEQCGFPKTVKMPNGKNVTDLEPKDYSWTNLSNSYVRNSNNKSVSFSTLYGNNAAHNASYFFRTLNGFSVSFLINPYCITDDADRAWNDSSQWNKYPGAQQHSVLDMICLMGIYDMNGKQGPNTVGKDIGFIGSFYNNFKATTAAVLPYSEEKHYASVKNANTTWDRLNNYCNNLGKDNEWSMPNIHELSLMLLNYKLINNSLRGSGWYFSSTPIANGIVWIVFDNPYNSDYTRTYYKSDRDMDGPYIRCVRKTTLR